jgi:APA family basic amino acid/polyamine antiporter
MVQLGLSVVLLLFAGNFRQLFSLAIFAEWLFYMISASTVFVLRKQEPDALRPYRTWGYPLVPAMFTVAATVLLYYTFTENLRNSAWGVAVIMAGVPIYFHFARKNRLGASNWRSASSHHPGPRFY